MYIFTYSPDRQEVTQGQFFNEVSQFWMSFPSPSPVAIPWLKTPVCPTMYQYSSRENSWIHKFPGFISAILNIKTAKQLKSKRHSVPWSDYDLFRWPSYIYKNSIVSKVGDFNRGWPESSLFNSYYTKK